MGAKINLKGKNILLLGPDFYGYCDTIKNELQNLEANVIFYKTQLWPGGKYSKHNNLSKCYNLIKNPLKEHKETKEILNLTKNIQIDILLVIAVYSSSVKLIHILKGRNPKMKTYIYFWDAFSAWDYSYLVPHFDNCFSFDLQDCRKYNMNFLPLFWRKEQLNESNDYIYDIVHIGALCPEYYKRALICPKIAAISKQCGFNNFLYLFYKGNVYYTSPWKNLVLKIVKSRGFRFYEWIKQITGLQPLIRSMPLPLDTVMSIEKSARAILDINMDRSGLSMRIIGALANGQKIITNNRYVSEYDFYSSDNIMIIDERNPQIDRGWLYKPTKPVNIDHLRIDNWINYILSFN